jgi:hypothetical protein
MMIIMMMMMMMMMIDSKFTIFKNLVYTFL